MAITPDQNSIDDLRGAPDRACATCGHMGEDHHVREIEEPGSTIQDTFCVACKTACAYIPEPEAE